MHIQQRLLCSGVVAISDKTTPLCLLLPAISTLPHNMLASEDGINTGPPPDLRSSRPPDWPQADPMPIQTEEFSEERRPSTFFGSRPVGGSDIIKILKFLSEIGEFVFATVILLCIPDVSGKAATRLIEGRPGTIGDSEGGQLWATFLRYQCTLWTVGPTLSFAFLGTLVQCLQIPSFEGNEGIRTMAILSIICALTSVMQCFVFMVHLYQIPSSNETSWVQDARRMAKHRWNIQVLLASPLVWFGWALILFTISFLTFGFRNPGPSNTGDSGVNSPMGVGSIITISFLILTAAVNSVGVVRGFLRVGQGHVGGVGESMSSV